MKKGFTLIELMVVIVIIGILAALAIPKFLGATEKAKMAEWKNVVRQIVTLQNSYLQYYDIYMASTGLSRTTYNGAKATACPAVVAAAAKKLGYDDPGPESRFNYWTTGKGTAGLGSSELAIILNNYNVGEQGLMDSVGTISGTLK